MDAEGGQAAQFYAEAAAMQDLPLPVQLIALATRYLAAAHSLSPHIAHRPSRDSTEEEAAHADYVSAYRRYVGASLTCCRAVVDGGKEAVSGSQLEAHDARFELRARAMLAEILVRETKDVAEAELHITKGLAMASKHASLIEYRYRFLYLQIELALATDNANFAKQTTKRCIKELADLDLPIWLYRFHLIHTQIVQEYENDYRSAVAALLETSKIARSQDDKLLHWVLQLLVARLAFLENDKALYARIFTDLASGFNLPADEESMNKEQEERMARIDPKLEKEEKTNFLLHTQHNDPFMQASLPRALIAQFLVMMSLYYTTIGQGPVAKQTVKRAHVVLDNPDLEAGQKEGWVAIPVATSRVPASGTASSTQSMNHLYLATAPKSLFYAYTFLVSTVIQIDPCGKKPRCLAYSIYGLDALNVRVRGSDKEVFPAPMGMADVSRSIQRIAEMQADLMLYQVELYIMRSAYFEAKTVLADLMAFVQSHQLWTTFCPRICLAQGMIYHSLGALDDAFNAYAVTCKHAGTGSHLSALARASLLLVRLAQGFDIRLSNDITKEKSNARLLPIIRITGTDQSMVEDYRTFVMTLLADCQNGGPTLQLTGLLLDAMTNAELVRAKTTLKAALQLSNQTNNQHIKPLVLALLSCYFKHTEIDQAQKMLHSSHTICRSMSAYHAERERSDSKKEKRIGPENVGNLFLGLWTGEELLSSYERSGAHDKAQKQELYNQAHREALTTERSRYL